jgi:hypothetical protein
MGSAYKKNNPNLRQPKMQHIRSIKPEFFQHEEVAELQPFTRLGWIGLWTCADKHGRFEWKPKSLKVKILPFDNVDFETLLAELADHNFIEPYEVDGQRYGRILNWSKHQGIGTREKESTAEYPAPSLHSADTVPAQDSARAMSVGVGVGIGVGEGEPTNQPPLVGGSGLAVCESQNPNHESQSAFRKAQQQFRQIVGKGLGALSSREDEWNLLIERAGAETVTAAVGIWARENAEFLGTARFPLAHFLKNSEEYVEAAKLRPLDSDPDDGNMPTVEDTRPPDYEETMKKIREERRKKKAKAEDDNEVTLEDIRPPGYVPPQAAKSVSAR